MKDTSILVTGANGYIASRLIPRLLEQGYHVRALARRPERLTGRAWLPAVEVMRGSTTQPESLAAALAGVHTAYYLVHNMATGRGYVEVDRESARRFAAAADAAGLQHIIYLGGLADPLAKNLAPHMRSRIETGEILRQGRVPVTEFRAGVIVGAGSISFEMIRFLTECFPILPGPGWLRNRAQPIAAGNVVDYLVAALAHTEARGGIYEMGGPERMQYADTMLRYARWRGLSRWLFTLPGIPIPLMARLVDWLTPVPYPIATALVGGLQSDSIVLEESALRLFPHIHPLPYEGALQEAMKDLQPAKLERVWEGLDQDAANVRHEGFFLDYRRQVVNASAANVCGVFTSMGGRNRWPYADWLWRLRGAVDKIISAPGTPDDTVEATGAGPSTRRGASTQPGSAIGDAVDYYRVEAVEPDRLWRLRSVLHAPGQGWMEWRVEPISAERALLMQTAFFAPRGLPGFLYWFLLGPAHRFVFRGMIQAIKRQSESS